LPKRFQRHRSKPVCVGQKQKWFLLHMLCPDEKVHFTSSGAPEFDDWRWVSYWYPISQVVIFKRDVYRRALKELAPWIYIP
jgi:putative (di)nucleoside polyphosphate hydrolase